MKLNKAFLLAPVALLSLTSCGRLNQRYKITKYIINYEAAANAIELEGNGNFNILQLSDLHMSMEGDAKKHYQFIKKTIDAAKVITKDKLHLIVITGDLFTFANKGTVKELCNFFEEQKVPWTLTFGNHDEQGYFSIDWMTNYLTELSSQEASNLLFKDYPDDDVFGSANFVINLPKHNNQYRQVIMIDSNRYNYGEGYGYDYIHYDQIDWYKRVHEWANDAGKNSNSLAFFHIPVPEFIDAYADAIKDPQPSNSYFLTSKINTYDPEKGKFEVTETEHIRKEHKDTSDGAPEINTGFFETARKFGYTKGMFVGHAHTNTNCMEYSPAIDGSGPNSVALCYGIKGTDRIYCDEEMMGGQLIRYKSTLDSQHADSTKGSDWFDLELIYHKYADLKEGK